MLKNATSSDWIAEIPAHREMLANRLRKRSRHLRKWAKRTDTSAYRIYDHDIPEIPLYVDRYNDEVVVSWRTPPPLEQWESSPAEHPWMAAMRMAIADALGIGIEGVFVRTRRPSDIHTQYKRQSTQEHRSLVREHGLIFEVNLSDYVDTGLFLDHRPSRARIGKIARGKRMLNLFGYTGAFVVHAAAGGAQSTLNLDLSAPYTAWAERNLAHNGVDVGRAHRARVVDVMEWMQRDALREDPFDIIVLDPPTHSRSKRMNGRFDVQRDHAWLLARCADLLTPGGILLFSNNYRRFRLDSDALAPFEKAEEITARSTPEDFAHSRPHRAWWLVKGR